MDAFLPWLWLAVAVLCVVIEVITVNLTTVWFALSAVALIFISVLRLSFVWQLLMFAGISCILLILTRPLVRKKLRIGSEKTNAAGLIGKKVLLRTAITAWNKGEVSINGIVWSAASADAASDAVEIPAGTECIIEKIEGATLIVKRTAYDSQS